MTVVSHVSTDDPFSNMGSLRSELLEPPPFSFTKGPSMSGPGGVDDEFLADEMMILGTTPSFGGSLQGNGKGSGTAAAAGGHQFTRDSGLGNAVLMMGGVGSLGGLGTDDIDDLMGMSPDLPSLQSKGVAINNPGFGAFMARQFSQPLPGQQPGGGHVTTTFAANGPVPAHQVPGGPSVPPVTSAPGQPGAGAGGSGGTPGVSVVGPIQHQVTIAAAATVGK
jgi:hypothetical protein